MADHGLEDHRVRVAAHTRPRDGLALGRERTSNHLVRGHRDVVSDVRPRGLGRHSDSIAHADTIRSRDVETSRLQPPLQISVAFAKKNRQLVSATFPIERGLQSGEVGQILTGVVAPCE